MKIPDRVKKILISVVVTAASVSMLTAPAFSAPKAQLKPVLKAIDPSQARFETSPETPAESAPVNPQLEQLIPEFGKPNPQVPPSMSAPMPPGPGFGTGWVPAAAPQAQASPEDPRVARLEQLAFGSTYPEHETDDRIEHLEREVFGKVSQGDPDLRIQKLQAKLGGGQSAFGGGPPASVPQTPIQPTAFGQLPPYLPQQRSAQQPAYQPPQQAYQPAQQSPYQQPQQPAFQPPQQAYQPAQQSPYQQPAVPYPPQSQYQAQPFDPSAAYPTQPFQQQQQQPYPQSAYQPPPQGYQQQAYASPYGSLPPNTVTAPTSIPLGPVTMQSFNRPAAPPSIPQGQPTVPATRPVDRTKSYAQPQQSAPVQPDAPGKEISSAAKNMPQDKKVGDYAAQISKFGGSFARWTRIPVRVHVPMNTPENWKVPLDTAVRKWSQYLPTIIAPAHEQADIEIGWINHLAPRQLGITNLEIFNGRPRVTVYLLRPNYYPPDISERKLEQVAIHELGHALGLFGHSPNPGDIMYPLDASGKAGAMKGTGISARDITTLRRIYSSPALPDGFQSPQPISWPFLDSLAK